MASLTLWANVYSDALVVLEYEGRLSISGKPFSGIGQFQFILLNDAGEVRWKSKGCESSPRNEVVPGNGLVVQEGRYSLRIGDPSLGHPGLPATVVSGPEALWLRVLFNDGEHGWHHAGTDLPLGALGKDPRGGSSSKVAPLQRESDHLRRQVIAQSGGGAATNRSKVPEARRSVSVPWRDAPALGAPDAPLIIMEFADFECPACRRTHQKLFNALVTNYVDSGQLLFVSRQMPLPQHKLAPGAARAAYCAGREDLYFEMYDRLYSDRAVLETNGMMMAASELGLNVADFERCLSDPELDSILQREAADAHAAGVTATPSFILGRRSGDRVNGVLIVGGRPFQFFQEEIARMLKSPP